MKRWHFFEEFSVHKYGRAKNTVIAVDTTQATYAKYLNTDFITFPRGLPKWVTLNAVWCFPNEREPMTGTIAGYPLRIRFKRIRRRKARRMYPRLSRFLRSTE